MIFMCCLNPLFRHVNFSCEVKNMNLEGEKRSASLSFSVNAMKYLLLILVLCFIPSFLPGEATDAGTTVSSSATDRWQGLAVSHKDRLEAAKALADYVCYTSLPQDRAANLLALALMLNPTSKEGTIANFQMKQGVFRIATDKSVSPEKLVSPIVRVANKLAKESDEDSQMVAVHLYYAATLILPSDAKAVQGYGQLNPSKNPLDWEVFYTEASFRPANATPERENASHPQASRPETTSRGKIVPAKNQSEIKGLYIIDLGMGKEVGRAFDVIATRRLSLADGRNRPGDMEMDRGLTGRTVASFSPFHFLSGEGLAVNPAHPVTGTTEFRDARFSDRRIGPQMRKSLKECYLNLMARNPTWGLHNVVISFEDDQIPADGPSATTVFGILLTSLQKGIDLDRRVAITGDMSADLNVRPIGGVRAKIMGAVGANCSYVGIPVNNQDDLMDALVLMTPDISLITRIQVIGLETLEQALTLAGTDRPKTFQKTLDEFAKLAMTLPPQGRLTPEQVSTLKDVLKKIPNHLSAKFLLERQEKGWPTTMTLRNSVYDLTELSEPFYERLQHPEGRIINLEFSQEFYMDLEKRLDAIRPYLHKDAEHLGNHFSNLVRDWRSVAYKVKNSRSAVADIKSSIAELNADLSSFHDELHKILTDESNRSEIME